MHTFLRLTKMVSGALTIGAFLSGCAGPEMTAKVWPTADVSATRFTGFARDYPEWEGRRRPARIVGLAFSGGGTLSATASVGAMRGLQHLGLLDDVDYLSGISGGTWGALPYVFLDAELARTRGRDLGDIRSQAQLEERYLGVYKPPGQLTKDDLTARPPGSIVSLVTDTAFRLPLTSVRGDENFAHMCSQTLLAPLGLGDDRRFVCGSEAQLRDILRRNPHLRAADFYVAGRGKPFLIAGMALQRVQRTSVANTLLAALTPHTLSEAFYPAEATPFYTGMPTLERQDFTKAWLPEPPVGGGVIETFGFDASFHRWEEPQKLAVVRNPGSAQWFRRGLPFSLGDMLGASGSAPATLLGAFTDALGIRPEFETFLPAQADPRRHSREIPFVDGGACDNTGVAALLAHGATHIVAFLNSAPAYDPTPASPQSGAESKVVTMLSAFFGRVGVEGTRGLEAYRHSVFSNPQTNHLLADPDGRKLRRIEAAFDAAARAGRPLVFCDDYVTSTHQRSLERYNVQPNRPVRICWVYLTASSYNKKKLCASPALTESSAREAWRKALSSEARAFFTSEGIRKHHLRDFPTFSLLSTDRGRIQQLNAAQANALAHYSAYNVVASAAEIRRAFSSR